MKILYLYAELMGYQIPVFKELTEHYKAKLHVVHWDHKKLTPYVPPHIENVKYYKRSEFIKTQLIKFAVKMKPDLVYVSGWMDKDYLLVAKVLRKKGIPVIAGSDTQWKGNFKQYIASVIFPITIKKYFSHIWVAGPYQYEYARKLGFRKNEILFNCLSADVVSFNTAFLSFSEIKKNAYPHRFLFVGRLENVKGIDLLIKAWRQLKEISHDWELCLIGSGALKDYLQKEPDVIVKDFLQPNELIREVEKSGCFILPSRQEPWALVIHEFAAAGMPIICSDICGAAPVFVVPSYNGYIFENNNVEDLIKAMLKIIKKSDQDLLSISEKSHKIGQKITPEIVAASLLSVLKK